MFSLFDDFPLILVIFGVLYLCASVALVITVFFGKAKPASALKPARSTGLKQSWQQILSTACEEQLSYLHDAQIIAAKTDADLQLESAYVEQLLERLFQAKTAQVHANIKKCDQELAVVASCAAAIKEAAVHIVQAANSSTSEVNLIDLRPAGRQLELAVEALNRGDLLQVNQCARAASELATLARQFALKLQTANARCLLQAGQPLES